MARPKSSPTPQKPVFEFTFRPDTFSVFMKQLHIAPTPFAKSLGHSVLSSVNRWMDGKPTYTDTMLDFCTKYRMNPLSYFAVNGYHLQTSMADLYLYERAGLSIRDELRRHGLQPSRDEECHRLIEVIESKDERVMRDVDVKSNEERVESNEASVESNADTAPSNSSNHSNYQPLSGDVLDRIIALQCQAHEHEQQALTRQRQDLQMVISQKDELIRELQAEVKKLRAKAEQARGYYGEMVADESNLSEK